MVDSLNLRRQASLDLGHVVTLHLRHHCLSQAGFITLAGLRHIKHFRVVGYVDLELGCRSGKSLEGATTGELMMMPERRLITLPMSYTRLRSFCRH